MSYINQLKYGDFINNTVDHFHKVKVINFDIVHKQCRAKN